MKQDEPNTPILDYSNNNNLFLIISDIWANSINRMPKMVVRAADNLGSSHVRVKRTEDGDLRLVKELSTKLLEEKTTVF
jgi:hypothetical protein